MERSDVEGPEPQRIAGEPQYMVIARTLANEIDREPVTVGSRPLRLPSERALAERFGCQRPTIREALQLLAGRGLIYRKDRSGWYVSPPPLFYNPTTPLPLSDISASQGRVLTTEVISTDAAGQPRSRDPAVQFVVVRRRSLDGLPVLIERIYTEPDLAQRLQELDLSQSIAYLMGQELGLEITHEHLTLNSTVLTPDVANLLYTRPGTPVLEIERARYHDETLISVDVELWRSEAINVTLTTNWNERSGIKPIETQANRA